LSLPGIKPRFVSRLACGPATLCYPRSRETMIPESSDHLCHNYIIIRPVMPLCSLWSRRCCSVRLKFETCEVGSRGQRGGNEVAVPVSFYSQMKQNNTRQRGVHYMGIKIFNNLPPYIKDIANNVKKFEICLKQFLHIHSFYSLEEYFQHKSITS